MDEPAHVDKHIFQIIYNMNIAFIVHERRTTNRVYWDVNWRIGCRWEKSYSIELFIYTYIFFVFLFSCFVGRYIYAHNLCAIVFMPFRSSEWSRNLFKFSLCIMCVCVLVAGNWTSVWRAACIIIIILSSAEYKPWLTAVTMHSIFFCAQKRQRERECSHRRFLCYFALACISAISVWSFTKPF